ncbi:MAG: uncharacterized protein QOF76_4576 [Solirubrobacteraceae bacterium]|nr:uncharacterized protein [Solirubrobacteraceae bacterium]
MPRARRFMTTEWRWLLGVTYAADPARLERLLPPGCEVDTLEGAARVSLVAFGFHNTRVGRFAIPGHVRFPEINLRFYIRDAGVRGVCFVRELVPRPAITLVARGIYNEPYRTTRMAEEVAVGDGITVRHRFGAGQRIEAHAVREGALPAEDSAAYWLTHHTLGVGRSHRGALMRYRVEHEVWPLHDVTDLRLDVDYGAVYGTEWAHLNTAEPSHLTLAAGSPVRVYFPT